MLYMLKNLAAFFLPPGIFIVLFFFLSLSFWKRNRRGAIGLLILTGWFYFFTTNFIGDILIGTLEAQQAPPANPAGDLIIVLGGGATLDTPDLDGEGNLSGSAANRLLTAVRLHKRLNVPILVSGGKVFEDAGTEAEIARRYLLDFGVPEDHIIVEDQSLNTRQNAACIKQWLEKEKVYSPLLVTSAFHMKRALAEFSREGILVTPYPCDYQVSRKNALYLNKFVPSAAGLQNTAVFFHEWLGIWGKKVFAP